MKQPPSTAPADGSGFASSPCPLLRPIILIVTLFSVIFTFADFPAHLRSDPWRAGQRHAAVCDLRVRYREWARASSARSLDRAGDAAGAGAADRGADHLLAEGMMVSGEGRIRQALRVWLAGRLLSRAGVVSVLLDGDHVDQTQRRALTTRM